MEIVRWHARLKELADVLEVSEHQESCVDSGYAIQDVRVDHHVEKEWAEACECTSHVDKCALGDSCEERCAVTMDEDAWRLWRDAERLPTADGRDMT